MSQKLFIAGATGTQGGALVRQLLSTTPTPTIHALARDPTSPKSKALVSLGVHLHHGGYDDEPALRDAITPGTSAIFLNFMPEFADLGANLRQAQLILSIAREVGVPHVVYSSGLGVDRLTDICDGMEGSALQHLLQSKVDIEKAIQGYSTSDTATYTILRPGTFMANYIDPFVRFQVAGLAETGRSVGAIDPDAPLPLVSTRTIGAFSAAALLEPARFAGKTVSYADEFVSFGDVIQQLRKVTGKDLQYTRMTLEDIEAQKAVNPFIGGALAVCKIAQFVDLHEVKSWCIQLQTFGEYLQSVKQAVLETYAEVPQIEEAATGRLVHG